MIIISWITWLPALIALFLCAFRSPQKALYSVYLPVLLLLPTIFTARTFGFPQLTFHQTTIIPITLYALLYTGMRWRWTLIDLLVILLILAGAISETINGDLHEGINRLANLLCNSAGPYISGKALIHSKQMTVPFSKRFVFLMCVNIVLGLYELRMTSVPQVFVTNWFFIDQNAFDWPPLYRYGFVRMSGPFMSPIFFGIAISVAILLWYWLVKNKLMSQQNQPHTVVRMGTTPTNQTFFGIVIGAIFTLYRWLKNKLFSSKGGYVEGAILAFGLLATFSRGPWLATLLAFFVANAAFSKHLKTSLLVRFSCVCLTVFILFHFFLNYQSVPTSETEGTIVYRANLWEKYEALIQEKFWLGWGLKDFPSEGSMSSIDNNYLYLWILNGMSSLILFLGIIFWGSVRLIKKGILSARSAPLTSSLAIIFFSIYVSFGIVFSTVYMGLQVEPLFFLFVGWSEGFILYRKMA